jgi:hypothetical protein
MLARLLAFGSVGRERSPFHRDWLRSLEWWSRRLDAVVWVDAPDVTLAERIRSRAKSHRAKHASDGVMSEFLSCYRAAFAAVVARLMSGGGPPLIHVDGGEPVDVGVQCVLSALRIRTLASEDSALTTPVSALPGSGSALSPVSPV